MQYVTYNRVSTDEQKKSGLGLEAQTRDIEIFLTNYAEGAEVVGSFSDTGSGADNDRPQLRKALALCRKTGATLVVAKLDRLSRRVSQIAQIMESEVRLIVASMPHADKFQLHIYAALAEQERTFISLRTKAALQMAKARGVKLGGDRGHGFRAANRVRTANADTKSQVVMNAVGPMRQQGLSLTAIADRLNTMSIPTSQGSTWTPTAVSRVLKRFEVAA